jgi:hypothetical protein
MRLLIMIFLTASLTGPDTQMLLDYVLPPMAEITFHNYIQLEANLYFYCLFVYKQKTERGKILNYFLVESIYQIKNILQIKYKGGVR